MIGIMSSLMWLWRRRIRASRLQMKVDVSRVSGCDILLLETMDLVHLDLRGCCNVTDEGVMNIAKRCRKLEGIVFGDCRNPTFGDAGVTALSHGCGQLRSSDLRDCSNMTDAGVITLSHRCGQLLSIDLTRCRNGDNSDF